MDEVVVSFPSREWAESAVGDLAAEGCQAELLPEPDACGLWQLRVSGPSALIAEIRSAIHVPAVRVDWEAFVNDAVGGSSSR